MVREIIAELCSRLEHEGIPYQWRDLSPEYWAYYQRTDQSCNVILSTNLRTQPSWLIRSVIFEEIGHHYTLEPLIYGTWPVHARRVHANRQEARAIRWAAHELLHDANWFEIGEECDWNHRAMAEVLDVSVRIVDAYAEHPGRTGQMINFDLCMERRRPLGDRG